ncbi:MAG: Gfo/Idh/MocA family oxidoreductase [Fimbriimonadaceae bacterium]
MEPTKIGIIGCGNISGIYFENLGKFEETEVVACADLEVDKAESAAKKYGCQAVSVNELLADPSIAIVVNLTVPKAHYPVGMAALEAGRSVYNEKPLAVERDHGKDLVDTARLRGLMLGCAPDTFLGAAGQTCRKLIDKGAIGEPIGCNCFMLCHGHESWHPSPEFYYEQGGGPMMDMGPYYLTQLVNLMGPIRRVSAMTRATFPTRTITSEPKKGKVIEVETPTHIVGTMEFASGAIGQITTSFDVWHSTLPPIEIYGTEGSMLVPDPNGFGGEVKIRSSKDSEWRTAPLEFGYAGNSRGLGVRDMVLALHEGRSCRASGELANHVLDVMHGFLQCAGNRGSLEIRTRTDIAAAPG